MAAKFDKWFNDKYGKNQSYGRGVALEAWNAAIKSVEEPFTSYNKPMPKLPQIRGMCSGCIYESDTGNSACNCCQRNPVFDDYYEVATNL